MTGGHFLRVIGQFLQIGGHPPNRLAQIGELVPGSYAWNLIQVSDFPGAGHPGDFTYISGYISICDVYESGSGDDARDRHHHSYSQPE